MPHGGARPNSGPKPGFTKARQTLLSLLKEKYPDYHPVVNMAKVANDPAASRAERFAADKEIAKYVTPALKAVEVTGLEGQPIKVVSEKPQSLEEWEKSQQ